MTSIKAIGVILPNMHDQNIPQLTNARTMASVPFGGRYRMIDFGLSVMVNAGVSNVVVVVKKNYRSLMDHLGSGREWDLARKRQGLVLFPPYGEQGGGGVYHGTIGALLQVLENLKHSKEKYVVLMDCNKVHNLNLSAVLEAHMKSYADVTVVYNKQQATQAVACNNVSLKIDENGRIVKFYSCENGQQVNLAMGIFVLAKEKLIELIEAEQNSGHKMFEQDVLLPNVDKMRMIGYEYKGYIHHICDMQSYYNANMELLEVENLRALFQKKLPVYTKVRDEAPVRLDMKSDVKNTLSADGCVIEGKVRDSVLFRSVMVKRGATVENCVLMQGTVIEENATVRYCITDKNVTITAGTEIVGTKENPLYIEKGKTV